MASSAKGVSKEAPGVSRGVLLMVAAAAVFSSMGAQLKFAMQTVPFTQAVFSRSFVALVLLVILQRLRGRPVLGLLGKRRKLLLLRGLLGTVGLFCFIYTVDALPLGESVLLVQLSAIFVLIFAALFLGERLAPSRIALVLLAVVGVAIVVRPGSEGFSPAHLLGLTGSALAGGAYSVVRKLTVTEDNESILAYFLGMAALAALPTSPGFVVPNLPTLGALLGSGVAAMVAQLLMNQAYRVEKAGVVAATGTVSVIFAGVWGFVLWSEVPGLFKAVGSGVILVAIGGLALLRDRPVAAR